MYRDGTTQQRQRGHLLEARCSHSSPEASGEPVGQRHRPGRWALQVVSILRPSCTWHTFAPEVTQVPGSVVPPAKGPVSAGRRWPRRRTAGHEVKLTVVHDGVGRDYRGRKRSAEAGHRYCPSQRCSSKPASSQAGQELSGCGDHTHATMVGGGLPRWSRSDGTCHGVRMARVSCNVRGLFRDRWLVPFGTSLTV